MTNRELIMEVLENLGYQPRVDEEDDIFIRYQMKTIFFLIRNEDEQYVSVVLPQFADVEEGEETLTLGVCNKMSRDLKIAKVYIDQTLKNVSASFEFFYTDQQSLANNVEYALKILGMVRTIFYKAKEVYAS